MDDPETHLHEVMTEQLGFHECVCLLQRCSPGSHLALGGLAAVNDSS